MQINSSNLNFKARMARNPDIFGYEKTKQETLSVYDAEINRIRALKKQAKEFDEFMHSKEIKELISKLPKEDEIIMRNNYYNEENALYTGLKEAGSFNLTYIQEETKHESIQPAMPLASKKIFTDIHLENGTLNKEGIIAWVKNLIKLFG